MNFQSVRVRVSTGLAVFAAAGLALPTPAAAQPFTCAPATVSVAIPAQTPVQDYAENFAFDANGNMWVSRLQRNEIERYDATGRRTATVAVDHPGALRIGPDGLLYAVYGNTFENALPGAPGGGVVRLDPTAEVLTPQPFASGLGEANGAAFDSAGNLYVADMFAGVVRFRPDGSRDREWSDQAKHVVVNGIAVIGDDVYATLSSSPTGAVLRIPIDAPSQYSVAANLAVLAPDDAIAGPDGMLYVATQTGRLVRADPVTGQSCILATVEPLATVAFVPGTRDLVLGTDYGNVLAVHLND